MPRTTVRIDFRSVASASARWTARRSCTAPAQRRPRSEPRVTEPHRSLIASRPIRGAASAAATDPEPFGRAPDGNGSPIGSAAASSNRPRERPEARYRGGSSPRSDRQRPPRGVQQDETTGKLLTDNPRSSSSSASGFPRVSATIRSRIRIDRAETLHGRMQKRASVTVPEAQGPPFRGTARSPRPAREPQEKAMAPQEADARQTRASRAEPRRATARRRRRRGADAPLPPPESSVRTASPTRNRSGAGPAVRPNADHRVRRAVRAEGVAPRLRAAAHTAGARTRTRAPSPTRHPRLEGPACPLPIQRHSSGALSFRSRPRRASAACDSRRRGARR